MCEPEYFCLIFLGHESEERAVVLYFKGRVMRGLDRKDDAIDCFMVTNTPSRLTMLKGSVGSRGLRQKGNIYLTSFAYRARRDIIRGLKVGRV